MAFLRTLFFVGAIVPLVTAQTCTSPTSLCTCYVDSSTLKKVITCRYKSLTSIPTFTPTSEIYDRIEFTSVEATGTCGSGQPCNYITTLPPDAFQNLQVREIDLRRNAISSFDVNAFRGLENILETLLIEGDGVIAPPYSSLSLFQVLNSLHLEHFNQAEFNTANTDLSFQTLKSLTIDNFKPLRTLVSSAFQNVGNIETFSLQNLHNLTALPVLTILRFSKLKKLSIYETAITQIYGESFKELTSLTSVNIISNPDLTIISSNAFDGASNTITFLDLFQNNLNSLNFLSQKQWPLLTQLNVGYNFVQVSDGTFSTMPNLNYLTMADMGLQSITKGMFTGLTNLHTLDLSFNSIQNVPADVFQNTPNLVDLRVNNQNENSLDLQLSFDDTAFTIIENSLQHLQLRKNRIDATQLWSKIEKFVNLIELNLADTRLASIPDYAFRYNVKLETIDLSENNITSLKQETFFGPRTTLQQINLFKNMIQTIDKCVLSEFVTQPEIFLTENPLHCDCQIKWLYQWVNNTNLAFTHVGECTSPSSRQGQYFTDFQETDLVCSPGYQEPTCRDLYATTTTSTTTTTITTTTTTPIPTTPRIQTPEFNIQIIFRGSTKMRVTWSVADRTYVTGYKLEVIKEGVKTTQLINQAETEVEIENLKPQTFYQFCLILKIENEFRESEPQCASDNTEAEVTEAPITSTPEPEAQVNIPVVVGSIVGGVILVALIIIIIFFIMKSKKPKKRAPMTQPVSFAWRADIPQAGGTAKRHAKKPDKEGASPDDITVNVISSGSMNNDRMSAGSYQYLKEKDPSAINTRPMPNISNGHYVNNIEARPLPRQPYGAGRNNTGYVNDAFHSGATNFPETSLNSYSEVVN